MPFVWDNHLPTLTATRIVLRHLTPSDVPDLFKTFSDPAVMRYRDGNQMASISDASAYLAQIHEGFCDRDLFEWGIADHATNRIMGTCTLLNLDIKHRRGEIGFALDPSRWGQGLAHEAVTALIAFCFRQLDLHRLEADCDPRNERSLRLLERLAFIREGCLRERYDVKGERQDAVVLGLLRSGWRGGDADPPEGIRV